MEIKELAKITSKLNLLFVEDSDIVRSSAIQLFEKFFDEVFVSVDGVEGYETFLEYRDEIDLIITDNNMPKMGGAEMIKKIREIDSEVKIVIFSGDTYEDMRSIIEEFDLLEHLLKPIDINTFVNLLRKIV